MEEITKEEVLRRRTQNVRKVDSAIALLELQIKTCIRNLGKCSEDEKRQKIEEEIELYTKLLSGAVIIWCECLIKALFYEPGAFKEEQINRLLSRQTSLEQKWQLALNCAFFKSHYQSLEKYDEEYKPTEPIPKDDTIKKLPNYNDIKKLKELIGKIEDGEEPLKTALVPAIDIRNKIQHGDWVYAFKEATFNPDKTLKEAPIYDDATTSKVNDENILTLRIKRNSFRMIYQLIKDLVVFKQYGKYRGNKGTSPDSTPFQGNFRKMYKKILYNQTLLENANYDKYKAHLISSSERESEWKKIRNRDTNGNTNH
jgi:hypothetical protein